MGFIKKLFSSPEISVPPVPEPLPSVPQASDSELGQRRRKQRRRAGSTSRDTVLTGQGLLDEPSTAKTVLGV